MADEQTNQLNLIRQELELSNKMYASTNGDDLQAKLIKEIGLTQRDAIAQGMPGAMKEQLAEMRAVVKNGLISNDIYNDLLDAQNNIADKIENGLPEQREEQAPEQQDAAQGFAAVLKNYLGSAGDYKQYRDKMMAGFNSLKDLAGTINNLPGVKGIKDGIGSFFEIIKTGILLIGGLVGLQGFLDGLNRIDSFFEGSDYAGIVQMLAAGLTGIVDAFLGLDPEQELAVATGVADILQTVFDFIKRIGLAFGKVFGIIESENESILTTIADYGIVIAAIGAYFSGPLLKAISFLPTLLTGVKFIMLKGIIPLFASIISTFGVFLVPITLLLVGIGFLIKDIMNAADEVGGIGNLIKLAFAYIQDAFISLINGAISLANKIPGVNISKIGDGVSKVSQVEAQISADKAAAAEKTANAIDEGVAMQGENNTASQMSAILNQVNQTNSTKVEINAGKIPPTNFGESLGFTMPSMP